MEQLKFIKECIIETLTLDHESYDLLRANVQEACEDNFIDYDTQLFNALLFEFINNGKVRSCLYDSRLRKLINSNFDTVKVKEYWFTLNTESPSTH